MYVITMEHAIHRTDTHSIRVDVSLVTMATIVNVSVLELLVIFYVSFFVAMLSYTAMHDSILKII